MSVNVMGDQVIVLDNVCGLDLAAIDGDMAALNSIVLSIEPLISQVVMVKHSFTIPHLHNTSCLEIGIRWQRHPIGVA